MNKQELFEKALNEFDEWPTHEFDWEDDEKNKQALVLCIRSCVDDKKYNKGDISTGGTGFDPYYFELVCTREEFEKAKAERDGFKSGQEIFIAQINTLAGVEGQRYFIKEYWCNSGHQRQYVELGIVFDNKKDAENKCKELLGIPIDTRTDKEKAVDDILNELPAFIFADMADIKTALQNAYDKWVGDKK